MPGGNGTGPMGMGPMTGWGRGGCARPAGGGRNAGAWGGRGWRNRFYASGFPGWQRTYANQPGIDRKEESALLKEQAEYLSGELDAIRSRITALEQEQK
jgi:hypothetical protein